MDVGTLSRASPAHLAERRRAVRLIWIGLITFAALAVLAAAAEATLLRFDVAAQEFLLGTRTGWLNDAMVGLTFLGSRYAIGAAATALLVWSLVTGKHRTLVAVIVIATLLNPILEIGLKELIGRVRPTAGRLLPGTGPSFPSGHVLAAVGFYGLIPLLMREVSKATWAQAAGFAASVFVIATVALSRPYLGVHWATDALAGLVLGLVTVATANEAYRTLALPPRERMRVG